MLGVAQFLMVLDTAVMNVSVAQLVDDFDTQVRSAFSPFNKGFTHQFITLTRHDIGNGAATKFTT